jgi:hypothetical protein
MLPPKRRKQLYVFGGRYPVEDHTKWMFSLVRNSHGLITAATWNDAIAIYSPREEHSHMFAVEHVSDTKLHLQAIHVSWKAEFNDIKCPEQEGCTFVIPDETLCQEIRDISKVLLKEDRDEPDQNS